MIEWKFSKRSASARWAALALTGLCLTSICIWAVACAGRSDISEPQATRSDAPRLLENLGDHKLPITTRSELAQRYFDQGLALTYGFNHDAAVRAFDEAIRLDPSCAMCSWGKALALGPNINAPMGPDAGRAAYAAIQQAIPLAANTTPLERDLIAALAPRYVAEPPEDRAVLDRAYADAMRGVHERHPQSTDVATLFAESLMDLYPWNYWASADEPREFTSEILSLLEGVMEREPEHLGANHFYIHATEEYHPEKAEPAADRLGALATDAGHLVHMPSHIYWRVGRYNDALEINQRAVAADETYFSWCRPGSFYRSAYYPHNVHFLWASAATEGRSEIALTAARKLAAQVEDTHAEFPFVEEFMPIPILTLVRFGRFDAVLGEPPPAAGRPYLAAIRDYARGLAFVRKGEFDRAEAALAAVRAAADTDALRELILAGGVAPAAQLLGIGIAHLEGELAAARGDMDAAVAALETAVSRQDEILYMEPPPWYFPTRQALGAVLLRAGRAADAEVVYRADLDQYPSNGWSLFGLARSLEAQASKAGQADWAQEGFARAWARADVELSESRF